MNPNKRSVTLDLKDPTHMAWLKGTIAQSDVLVQNMRPGVLEDMGLGAAAKLYPEFLKNHLFALRKFPKEIGGPDLDAAADALKQSVAGRSLAAMQKNHRAFLLMLERRLRMRAG